jgi:hypothetical protein
LIDACQLRLSPAAIRGYLQHDLPVAITGSKFLGGPSFSGALLFPRRLAVSVQDRRLPNAIGDYLCAADFPRGWAMRDALPGRANLGMLLRWQAALFEWERLLAVPTRDAGRIIYGFARAVEDRLRRDPALEQIAARALDRHVLEVPDSLAEAIDKIPTIFPFLLTRRDAAGRKTGYLSSAEMRAVYDKLASGEAGGRAVRLGQPVALGERFGTRVSALRLCLGSRQIADASAGTSAYEALVQDAMKALDHAIGCALDVAGPAHLRRAS